MHDLFKQNDLLTAWAAAAAKGKLAHVEKLQVVGRRAVG
jgi:hypothetical protein